MGKQLFSGAELICRVVAALSASALAWGCGAGAATFTNLPDTTLVSVREVKQVEMNESLVVSGTLEAHKTAPLSFLVPGKVDHVHVDEGDRVTVGQVLAAVESHDYVSQVEIAEAALLRAQDAHDRFAPLVAEGAFAESDFIELKSGLAQAVAALDIARKRLQDTVLCTPIAGIVGMKNVELGQMVSPAIPAFTVVKTDIIFARVAVPESEVGKVEVGYPAAVMIPALGDRKARGKISLIGAVADPQTRSFTVKVELANPRFHLRPGMIVEVEIATDRKLSALTVPVPAIVRDADDHSYVFTVNLDQGRAERRRVDAGTVLQNEVEIASGLEPGDLVVIGGHHKLSDGALITVEGI